MLFLKGLVVGCSLSFGASVGVFLSWVANLLKALVGFIFML